MFPYTEHPHKYLLRQHLVSILAQLDLVLQSDVIIDRNSLLEYF